MPYTEFLLWQEYFELRPPEWRDDFRASVIASAMGGKGADKAFPSLRALEKGKKRSDMGLKTSAFFLKMQSAIGGDKLDLN